MSFIIIIKVDFGFQTFLGSVTSYCLPGEGLKMWAESDSFGFS